jgi:hypothetical protein
MIRVSHGKDGERCTRWDDRQGGTMMMDRTSRPGETEPA